MGSHETQNHTPAAADQAATAEQHHAARRERRADRTVELTEEEIAAIEATEIVPGFEQHDAELEPEPATLVEEGVRFARDLGQRGDRTKGRRADKAFRDSLYDDN